MNDKPIHVLLVEDEAVVARVTQQMLKDGRMSRYSSTLVTRLSDALAALDREDFDLVLLDLNLPDSRDLDTVRRIATRALDIPVIVLTASNVDGLGLQALQLGAQDFLSKGNFDSTALDRAITFALERHRLQRTLAHLAVIDELTGLYNRRGFNTLRGDYLQDVALSGNRGYLCFFDLDGLKQINDGLGHAAGDDALKDFATGLQNIFRKDTLLARLGGDEFVAMGVESTEGELEETVATLQIGLAVRNVRDFRKPAIESSHGVAFFQGVGPFDITQLSAAADQALYRRKQERETRRGSTADRRHETSRM